MVIDEEFNKREIFTFSSFGYEGAIIKVETDLRGGIPAYDIVGLADSSVKESRERVRAALNNSGIEYHNGRVLQSLSPADLKKEGSSFDLAMALGILNEQTNYKGESVLVMGALGLSGNVIAVRGVHAAVQSAVAAGITNVIVPKANEAEALEIPGVKVLSVESLSDAHTKLLNNEPFIEKKQNPEKYFSKDVEFNEEAFSEAKDLDLTGHYETARAIEVAIAGKHNILLTGAPGSGKTMLSQRLIPALTPNLTQQESQSTTRIWSIAGLVKQNEGLKKEVPFRMPHQTASIEGICGGGINCQPGEISLAHNGVLFLDEAAEFRSSVLQIMRVPLENKSITLSRAGRSTTYPSNFQLVMATNPCPCGNYGSKDKICFDSARSIENYWGKFSNPLMDRVPIKNFVVKDENDSRKVNLEEMKKHIENAIRIQRENKVYNQNLTPDEIEEFCKLDEESAKYLQKKSEDMSPRYKANILKVALTIANMDNRRKIQLEDLQESVELTADVFNKLNEYKRDPDKKQSFENKTENDNSVYSVDLTNTGYLDDGILTIDLSKNDNTKFKITAFDKRQNKEVTKKFDFAELFDGRNNAQKILTEPTKIMVNGKERECKSGIRDGFINAVKQLDILSQNYNDLVDNYNNLKDQLNTRSYHPVEKPEEFER